MIKAGLYYGPFHTQLKCLILQGLIQSVFELHDGSGIVVTVGKYVTPDHKDINGDGIEPDYRRLPGAIHIHGFYFCYSYHAMWLTAWLN